MKKYIAVDVLIFIAVSVYATIQSAMIDAGSVANGHTMSMGEAIIFDIPLGISEGAAVAGVVLLVFLVGRAIYKEVKR